MSRSPAISCRVESLRTSVFAVLAKRLAGYSGKRYPFHIGDNVAQPPAEGQWGAVDLERFGPPYRYGHPNGELGLREALAAKARARNGMTWAEAENVQVSVGATHAIACALQALLDPGAEVLLLAPYWPLVRGLSHCAATTPIDVPFYQALLDDPTLDPSALIRPYITERTRMLYLISPNNPNGMVLTTAQLDSLAALACEHDLWVVSDEAYESFGYAREPVSIATRAGMADRTISVFTFSKSYAMAGTRVGYLIGPRAALAPIRKVATHSVYNTAQVCQSAAFGALSGGDRFLASTRSRNQAAAAIVAERLEARFHPAQGGAFVFLDLREHGPDALPILQRAADRGVTLAPGEIFGAGYGGYARFCYTAVDEETLREGIDVLNEVLRAGL